MRTMVLSLAVLAAIGLAGCSGSGSGAAAPGASGSATTAAAGSSATEHLPTSVSGTVGLRNPGAHTLSNQAKLTIKLVDLTQKGATPLDVKVIAPVTTLPAHFSFTFKPGQIHASNLYVVQAQIVDGIRHYTMPLQAPVLTKGAPAVATIRLVAVPTPGEKLLTAFKKLKAQAGAMEISKGTSLSKHHSARGWQVFRDKASGKVRYVVELTKVVKGGFIHTEFAYTKKGKPWVVIRKKKASQHGKPTEIDRAGWDDNGKLILKEQVANGKTTTLDADTAAKLHKAAIATWHRAQKTK